MFPKLIRREATSCESNRYQNHQLVRRLGCDGLGSGNYLVFYLTLALKPNAFSIIYFGCQRPDAEGQPKNHFGFLDASSHLFKRVCPLLRPSVRPWRTFSERPPGGRIVFRVPGLVFISSSTQQLSGKRFSVHLLTHVVLLHYMHKKETAQVFVFTSIFWKSLLPNGQRYGINFSFLLGLYVPLFVFKLVNNCLCLIFLCVQLKKSGPNLWRLFIGS